MTFALFVGAFVLANLKTGHPVRDFLASHPWLVSGVSVIVRQTTDFYAGRIRQFQPRTVLEAKRANEQIKSLSTAINALAAGGAVAVTAKQMTESVVNYPVIIIAVGLAVWVHTGARSLLSLLKDESAAMASRHDENEQARA